ncbi:MAG TPA: calcium-binding protein [Aestuariivirga sp.]|nr:calcium-binding protein [Aestuariivirga sp.]
MPGTFELRPFITSDNLISQTTFSTGPGNGIDDPLLFSTLGGSFLLDPNQIASTSTALLSGQTLSVDVDFGNNSIDPVNTAMWVIDINGNIVASNNNSSPDVGSIGNADPKLQFTAAETGVYIILVAQKDNNYIDGTFEFTHTGTDTGVFMMNVGLAGLPALATGTNGDDNIILTTAERRYDARGGADYIQAEYSTRSVIDGGGGDDSLYGSQKSDILIGGGGRDYLFGDAQNDVLVGGRGGDYLYGGDGADQILGGIGADYLKGDNGSDLIHGEEGDDTLIGGAGDDQLFGDYDNDWLEIDDGNDLLDGGDGQDTLYGGSIAGVLTIDLRITTAQDTTSAGMDTIVNIETVYGTNGFGDVIFGNNQGNNLYGYGGDDQLFGLAGDDYLSGGDGNDTARGGNGVDGLNGDAGEDRLFGDAGSDYLTGGADGDRMWGGTGNDYFYYNAVTDSLPGAMDILLDFDPGENDRINFSGLPGTLVFRGYGPYQNTGGEVRVEDHTTFQKVFVNLDTNPDDEMVIRVNTSTPLVEADFIL